MTEFDQLDQHVIFFLAPQQKITPSNEVEEVNAAVHDKTTEYFVIPERYYHEIARVMAKKRENLIFSGMLTKKIGLKMWNLF